MFSIITFICLLGVVGPAAIANIFAYPVSKKLSIKISHYIQKVCALRVFRVFNCYKNFKFWGYKDHLDELPEQFMIISNHQSLLDIPVYMNFLRNKELRFVAKDSLSRHVPLVSEMLRSEEHCCIPRKAKPMEAMKYVDQFGKRVVLRNQIPVLFPEGTRTRDGEVGKFYSAGFRKLSESSKLPVVACALDGGYLLRDVKKLLKNLNSGSYRVKVMKIYPCPQNKDEVNALLEDSRSLIQQQLQEWRKLSPLEK